jgi:hypothetical protein
MAAMDLAAWGVGVVGPAARPVPAQGGAAGATERREDDARQRAREAAWRAQAAAKEAERHLWRVRAAEVSLAEFFNEGVGETSGLRAQNPEVGGGTFHNGDALALDGGLFDPHSPATGLHGRMRDQAKSPATKRYHRVVGTFLALRPGEPKALMELLEGPPESRLRAFWPLGVLALAYTSRPTPKRVRDVFRRLSVQVPVIEGGRAVTHTVQRKERKLITRAAAERHSAVEAFGLHVDVEEIAVETEEPLTVEMTSAAAAELGAWLPSAKAGVGAWLLKRGLSATLSRDDPFVRRECLALMADRRQADTASANLLGRVLREATAVLDEALAAYVAVGERAREAKRAERKARAVVEGET